MPCSLASGRAATAAWARSARGTPPATPEFLFSRNRLDVAISRARRLAFVVYSPRLLDAPARSVDEMRLINALCLLVETATDGSTSSPPASAASQ